jgi:nucleoside phosphorylase
LVSVDHVAATASEKRALAASGALAVEMEAAGVLERAAALGVPFYCIRVVSDTADDTFVVDFNAARRADGRFDRGHIVKQALRRPLVMIPELLRLRGNAAKAVRALGDFVADCDF